MLYLKEAIQTFEESFFQTFISFYTRNVFDIEVIISSKYKVTYMLIRQKTSKPLSYKSGFSFENQIDILS